MSATYTGARSGGYLPSRSDGGSRRSHRGRHMWALWLLIVLFLLGFVTSGSISATEGEAAEAAARQALRQERFPWYDKDIDDVRAVRFRVSASVEARSRHSTWVRGTSSTPANSASSWRLDSLGFFNSEIWSSVASAVGILLLLGLVVLLVWTFVRLLNQETDSDDQVAETEADSVRMQNQIEKLPFEMVEPPRDLLAAARKSYESGDIQRAIIYLFGYQLMHLDNVQAIQLEDGKTNRQCLAELTGSKLHAILERTMVAFEDVFFGKLPLEPAAFEQCWNDLELFHQYADLTAGR